MRILEWIVFQIRILNQGEIAARLLNRGPDSRPFPAILFVPVELDLGKLLREPAQNVECAIGRAVIHNYQFPFHVFRQRSNQYLRNAPFHDGSLIIDRHQNRELHEKTSLTACWGLPVFGELLEPVLAVNYPMHQYLASVRSVL
jgi:hypothetical protein